MKAQVVFTSAFVLLVSALFFSAFRQINTDQTPTATTTNNNSASIHWMSLDEVENALKKEKRKVIVVLYTNWCGWCKRLERETLQDEQIAAYLNKNYYAVHFNAEERQKITFKGKEYKFVQNGRRGYNQLARELTGGRLSYPTCVFLDENLELIQSIPGYKSAKDFLDIISYFGGDYYRKMSWDRYLRMQKE